eukprot:s2478_g4.t1
MGEYCPDYRNELTRMSDTWSSQFKPFSSFSSLLHSRLQKTPQKHRSAPVVERGHQEAAYFPFPSLIICS